MYVCMYVCIIAQLLSAKAVVYLLNASSRDYLRLLSTDNRDHDQDQDHDQDHGGLLVDGSCEEKKNHHSSHRVSSNKKLEAVRLARP